MDSLLPTPRLRSWLRPAVSRPTLRLEQLEDRTVPSSSIQLSGLGFKPLGGTIIGANPSLPTLPAAGRVTSFATPFNAGDLNVAANTIYAGTPGGGVAASDNGGQTWRFLTDNLPLSSFGGVEQNRNLHVGALSVSPFDPPGGPGSRVLLAGLGEANSLYGFSGTGLLRSPNNGLDWSLIKGPTVSAGGYTGPAFEAATFEKFVYSPLDPNFVFAVVNGPDADRGVNPVSGVYRSTDGGQTWVDVTSNITGSPLTRSITDFILDPTNPSVAYVAVSGAGVFRSSNFLNPVPGGPQPAAAAINFAIVLGGTGTQVDPASLVTVKLAFGLGTPTQPSRVYALSAGPGDGSNQLFRSDDSGINFRRLDPFPTPNVSPRRSPYNLQLIADPTTPNRIYLGGRGDGSIQVLLNADFNSDFGQTPVYVNLTPVSSFPTTLQTIRDMRFDNTGAKDNVGRPIEPGRLVIATDAGLFRLQAPNNAVTLAANYTDDNLELVSLNGATGPNQLNIQQFFSTALPPRDDNQAIGGTYLNGQAIFSDNGPFTVGTPEFNALYGFQASIGDVGVRGTGGNTIFSPIDPTRVYRVSNIPQPPYFNTDDVVAPPLFQRSTDRGASWTTSIGGIIRPEITAPTLVRNPEFKFRGGITPLIADPFPIIGSPESRLFLGTDVVNISNNGGQSWGQYGSDLPFVTPPSSPFLLAEPRITALGTGLRSQGEVFAGVDFRTNDTITRGAGIYRTFGLPNDWINVSPGTTSFLLPPAMGALGEPVPNALPGAVLQIIVDPADPDIVYAITIGTGAGRIFRTTNGGFAWDDITANLPGDMNQPGFTPGLIRGLRVFSITQDPNQLNVQPGNPNSPVFQEDDDLYIGTSLGVWKLTNPTLPLDQLTWTRLAGTGGGAGSTGGPVAAGSLPDVMVRDVELNTTTGVLSAATFGRGLWQFQVRPFVRGLVFLDQNGNGVKNEPPDTKLPNAVVLAINQLTNPPSQFANATTTANGEYVFRSLPDSTYSFIPADASTKLVDPTTRFFFTGPPVVINANETTTANGQDLFVFDRVSISGRAYIDNNGNGVRDAGEPPAANFPVVLVAPAGTLDPAVPTPIATVTTDAAGNYTFFGVGPLRPNMNGPSTQFAAGYQVTVSKAAFQTTDPADPIGPLTSNVDIVAADTARTQVGVFQAGRLSGSVYEDFNGDGVRNPGEQPEAGFTVELRDANSNALRSVTQTAADGTYTFGNLSAGLYRIVIAQAGFAQTTTPFVGPIISGVNTGGLDIGVFAAAALAGVAFEDLNGNGFRDGNENSLVAGVGVILVNPLTNTVEGATQTDAGGNFSFGNLFPIERPGNRVSYLVRLTDPTAGFVQSSDPAQPMLLSGQTVFTGLGLFRPVTVSGFAFEDIDGSGFRDGGEPGLAGGLVSLINSNTGDVVYTTTSDANGNFVFTGVGPIPGGAPFRVGASFPGTVQTTANPPDFFVMSGRPVGGFMIGLFRTAPFTGVVFEDLGGDGRRDAGDPGLAGQTVQLVDAFGTVINTTMTDGNGFYQLISGPGSFRAFQPAPAGVVVTTPAFGLVSPRSGQRTDNQDIGDFRLFLVTGRVFNDLNGNGNGAGDPGAAGVTVRLVNAANGAVLAQTTTDGNGNYFFPNIGPGTFRVEVVGRTGLIATTPGASSFTGVSGRTVVADFGTFAQASVGGNIYEDLDRTGTPTAGDVPAGGFTVQLLLNGAVVQTVTSNGNGDFGFGGLAPGAYTVRVVDRLGFSTLTNGSQNITLTSGQSATLGRVGVLRLASVSGSVFLDPNRNSRRDATDRGLAGGVVGLFDAAGTQLATQTTDANGNYAFFGLQSGDYTVRLLVAPSGFQPTRGGSVVPVTLAVGSVNAGNNVTNINFGLLGRDRYALAADGGGGPRVQVFDAVSNVQLQDFFVYELSFTGGVRVSTGDVNGDGIDDLVVVPGKGGGPRVRVLDGVDQHVLYDYFAYEPTFTDGLFVAAGDVDGDGYADLVTGTAPGGGPRVTVRSGRTGEVLTDFFAYDSGFRGGVRIAVGDTDGDGVAEIITAPGVGGGPDVRVFGGRQFAQVGEFAAFDPSYTGGVYLAAGPVGPTGRSDIVVGSGQIYPGSPVPVPVVRVFDAAAGLRSEIEAFPGAYQSEVRVATFDRTGDGIPDIAAVNGPGSPPRLRFYDGVNNQQVGDEQMPYEFAFTGGIFIG